MMLYKEERERTIEKKYKQIWHQHYEDGTERPHGILGKFLLNVRQNYVTLHKERSVASLKRDWESLEEMFDGNCISDAPSSRSFGRNLLEKIDSDFVPASEGFDDEWMEEDPFCATVVCVRRTALK